MKITIKTFAAIAALTAFALFSAALFSCEPEVETPSRSIGEAFAQYSPSQIGYGTGVTPVTAASINITGRLISPAVVETDKDLTITFPKQADVLRESNANMENALKKFLSFHTYTNPTSPAIGKDHSDVSDTPITYKFISRSAGLNSNTVTIRLDSLPTQNFVAKFNQNFTYGGGYKIDFTGNNYASSSPIYDDLYKQLNVTGATTVVGDFVKKGHQGWNIVVGDITAPPGGSSFTTPLAFPLAYSVFSLNTNLGGGDYTTLPAENRKLLDEFKDKAKFELQKWDGSAWVKDTTEIRYITAPSTSPSVSTSDYYVVFTPVDLTAYRIVATNAANLQTNGEYYGQPQKITVRGGDVTRSNFFHNTVAGDAGFFVDTDKHRKLNLSGYIVSGGSEVTSDKDGLNVVLTIRFKAIEIGDGGTLGVASIPASKTWLKQTIDLAEFNKNFKIVGSQGDTPTSGGINNSYDVFDDSSHPLKKGVFFVNITKVETRSSPATTGTDLDELVITLDPSYRYNDVSTASATKAILIGGLDAKWLYNLSDDKITFGGFSSWGTTINGVKYWDFGGTIPENF